MTRHANAARDLAALLADASPDVAAANAPALAALRAETAADLANAHVAAMLRTTGEASVAAARRLEGDAPTEHDEQVALFRWAAENEAAHPELRMLHATPNGGYRPIVTAVKMQQEGQKRGYPDISLDVARGKFHGLRIELKRRKGARISAEQEEWIARLRHYGYCACVCYGAGEAINCIMGYLAQEGA
jgi:hypothetical protein